jgi:hypothetical protein
MSSLSFARPTLAVVRQRRRPIHLRPLRAARRTYPLRAIPISRPRSAMRIGIPARRRGRGDRHGRGRWRCIVRIGDLGPVGLPPQQPPGHEKPLRDHLDGLILTTMERGVLSQLPPNVITPPVGDLAPIVLLELRIGRETVIPGEFPRPALFEVLCRGCLGASKLPPPARGPTRTASPTHRRARIACHDEPECLLKSRGQMLRSPDRERGAPGARCRRSGDEATCGHLMRPPS